MFYAHLATLDHQSYKDRIMKIDYKEFHTKKLQNVYYLVL